MSWKHGDKSVYMPLVTLFKNESKTRSKQITKKKHERRHETENWKANREWKQINNGVWRLCEPKIFK